MRWKNLKANKCPKCNEDLGKVFYDGRDRGSLIICTCGFSISEKRMSQIISNLVSQDLDREEPDRSEWE